MEPPLSAPLSPPPPLSTSVGPVCRNTLRLHPGVPSQHREVAPHHAHAALRPLQARLRRPPLGQLQALPPPAAPGNVPPQGVAAARGRLACTGPASPLVFTSVGDFGELAVTQRLCFSVSGDSAVAVVSGLFTGMGSADRPPRLKPA